MQHFASERPEASPGNKALLLDGSAIPYITIRAKNETSVQLLAMLRNYSGGSAFTYTYHYKDLLATEVSQFFVSYLADPELTLKLYFAWEPQAVTKAWTPNEFKKVPQPSPAGRVNLPPSTKVLASMDLI